MTNVQEIKQALLQTCFEKVETRFQKIKQTIADIDESLEEETKSSAGDKHETGRAMLQIDRENATKQMYEVQAIKELLKKVDVTTVSDYVRLGSLVKTSQATYFMSLSIGAVMLGEENYLCVALNSPIGELLKGKKKGEELLFNQQTIIIKQIL